jgi:TatD family-associated radical SAM protein
MDKFDFSGYKWLVFCGYGEPTCELGVLLEAARYAKEKYHLKIHLNTNGLGSLENGHDIVPELSEVLDAVSISLNAPNAELYNNVTRPTLPGAFEAMLSFTEECGKSIPDVQMTIVDVLPLEQQEQCRKLAQKLGVRLRIRHYS